MGCGNGGGISGDGRIVMMVTVAMWWGCGGGGDDVGLVLR